VVIPLAFLILSYLEGAVPVRQMSHLRLQMPYCLFYVGPITSCLWLFAEVSLVVTLAAGMKSVKKGVYVMTRHTITVKGVLA